MHKIYQMDLMRQLFVYIPLASGQILSNQMKLKSRYETVADRKETMALALNLNKLKMFINKSVCFF